jgi:hypothetical protein
MRCAVKGSFEMIFGALDERFGNIYSRKFSKTGEPTGGIVLGEQYFFRVGSDAAILITLEKLSASDTRIEVISWAGGKGFFSISYGAHSDFVHDVCDFLSESGFEIMVEEEISYFDRTKSINIKHLE